MFCYKKMTVFNEAIIITVCVRVVIVTAFVIEVANLFALEFKRNTK